MHSAPSISLYFVGSADPILVKVIYRPDTTSKQILSVRGKTGGAFDTECTFQWTAAVQGLCALLLKKAVSADPKAEATLSGGQGSVAASLDYALDKQPAWLADMFGLASDGNIIARKIFRRTNPGRKSKGPVVIGINKALLGTLSVAVFLDDVQVGTQEGVSELLSLLIEKIGIAPVAQLSELSPEGMLSPDDMSGFGVSGIFKTPFILRSTQVGFAFTRLYQQGGSMFFVASYGNPSQLIQRGSIPVRFQFLCPGASAFNGTDCDCSAQLEEATELLSVEGGVLVCLVPENAHANLFSSYLGNAGSSLRFFAPPHISAPTPDSKQMCIVYNAM